MSNSPVNQRTIASEVTLTGVGLHTGKEVSMTFKPAPENNGFTFVRIDLEGSPVIEADANYVVNTQRGTVLEKEELRFKPVSMFWQLWSEWILTTQLLN